MQRLSLARLTPASALAILTAVLSCATAFGAPLTANESHSVLVLGGSLSLILFAHGLSKAFTYLAPQSVVGLVTAVVGVASAFGLPVTHAQADSILTLTGLFAGILLTHGVVHTVARDRRDPQPSSTATLHIEPVIRVAQGTGVVDAVEWGGAPAVGIHAHPTFKTGLKPSSNKPALLAAQILTGIVPKRPVAVDHIRKLAFGLYSNDRFGVCGPTSVANLVRLVTAGLLGTEIQPSQEDVFELYRRSGNPNFDPNDPNTEDNGVDMQTMLEALMKYGIGDGKGGTIKPIAVAKVDPSNDAELEAGVSIFGGTLWGTNLETAQQAQTNRRAPQWSYRSSSVWGGHAVMNGAYEGRKLEDVISWAKRVRVTRGFRRHQLEQAWLVIWPWNIEHPAFQKGVDIQALRAAYKALTGRELVLPNAAA